MYVYNNGPSTRLSSFGSLQLVCLVVLACCLRDAETNELRKEANYSNEVLGVILYSYKGFNGEDQLAMRTNYCWLPGQTGPRTNGRGPAILCLSFQFYLAVKSKGIEN